MFLTCLSFSFKFERTTIRVSTLKYGDFAHRIWEETYLTNYKIWEETYILRAILVNETMGKNMNISYFYQCFILRASSKLKVAEVINSFKIRIGEYYVPKNNQHMKR